MSLSVAVSPFLLSCGDLQAIVLLLIFELRNHLPRADQLLVLIVETLEAVAADAALFAVELLRAVQDRGVLGNHVRSVALLAAGFEIFRVIQAARASARSGRALFRRCRARGRCRRGMASSQIFPADDISSCPDRDGW